MRVVEVQDSSGTKVAQIDHTMGEATVRRELNGVWQISVTYVVPVENDISDYLVEDGRLRVIDPEDTTDYQDYLINEVTKERKGEHVVVSVQGDNLAMALMGREVINAFLDFKGETPSNIMDDIMSYSSYGKGTVNPTTPIDLTISYETVLSALQKLTAALGVYFDVDEPNTEIDILTSVGSDNNVRITPGHNLISLSRRSFNREVVNKVFGVGGGEPPVTIGGAAHQVLSESSNVITTVGNKVVPENDAWNTSYEVEFITGANAASRFTITDCVHGASNDTITIAGSPGAINPYDLFMIVDGATNVPIDYIPHGNADKEGVYANSSWQENTNYVKNAVFERWTGRDADDWSDVGTPTRTRDTTNIKYGQDSQKISCGSGEGILQTVTHYDANQVWSLQANIYVEAGSCVIAFQNSTTTGYFVLSSGTGWQTLVMDNVLNTDNDIDVYILAAEASTIIYVDSVSLVKAEEAKRIANVSEQKTLWDEAFDKLLQTITPRVTYSCQFADLHRIDPGNYPFAEINIGDTVHVIDEELNVDVDVLVVSQNDRIFEPEKMESTISNE